MMLLPEDGMTTGGALVVEGIDIYIRVAVLGLPSLCANNSVMMHLRQGRHARLLRKWRNSKWQRRPLEPPKYHG